MKTVKTCPHCAAKMVEYKHNLSKVLIRGLARIVKRVEPELKFKFKQCSFLSYSEASNMQKLQHWGIIRKADPETKRGGDWIITPLAIQFLKGETRLPPAVWTYRGERVRYEGEQVTCAEVTGCDWKYRPEYAEEAQPHGS